MSLKIERRQFLQFAAGGAVGVATSGISACGLSQLNAAIA
ncbi:MAG: twin-arginine translocation signal domain-containing protein, partial [Acidobacteriales bacterium]|nr:twin-arginine translocation signal domain-containing protein [Terriglobales bacterium]